MKEDNFTLPDITVYYGKTTVQELLAAGYRVSDFSQITQEPVIATCNLYKGGELTAVLYFYSIQKKIALEQLAEVPVDMLIPPKNKKRTGKHSGKALSPKQVLAKKIKFTCLVHLAAAGIYTGVYAVPALFTFVQNTGIGRTRHAMPLGMLLLVLPALLITFVWADDVIGEKGQVFKKLLLSLWLIFHVAFSLAYLILIDYLFKSGIL